jgi:hypothetical protein
MENIKYHTMEAVPKQNAILDVPNFHILAHRNEDNTMCGYCLDFGFWAFSESKDDDEALNAIFEDMAVMALAHITTHLSKGTIDFLYDNMDAQELSNKWFLYSNTNRESKIKKLKQSFEHLISNPGTLQGMEINVYNFSKLSAESRNSLTEILNRIQELTPEEAAEIIGKLLVLTRNYNPLRVVA